MTKTRTALIALALATAAAGGGFLAGHATAQPSRHPNIDAAQRDLRQALGHLNRAPDIFGGHKQRAIELIQAAQAELRQAERFRR
ncbi:MAG TPA: hypothetical protein VD970_04835 [Acetobacteraceae bacterium]|nr:hypothetical protein [Acetobacteraceae bacterium]